MEGVDAFHCDGDHITAKVRDSSQLPVELIRWITSHGGHVRSMKVRSITLFEALIQQTKQQEDIL
jgi:hypothetical protein